MTDPSGYSVLDRIFHRLAFSNIPLQLDLSAREDRNNQSYLSDFAPGPSAYVTSLPRAGTTLLLTILSAHPDFASHTYRQMPVLFAPLTWQKWSRRFEKKAQNRERAHGDGLDVSEDSAEAFEEAIWHAFWQNHYSGQSISLWNAEERHSEFDDYYRRHRAKLVLARRRSGADPQATRYLAKNNANISRIDWLAGHEPDARIIVPVRNPFSHIASLMRQDENFMRRHGDDRFAERYMNDLGHFEFGALHRLISFQDAPDWQPFTGRHADYWARYWRAAYRHILATQKANVILFDHDAFGADPQSVMKRLCTALGIDPAPLLQQLTEVRPPRPTPQIDIDATLAQELSKLHQELIDRAI